MVRSVTRSKGSPRASKPRPSRTPNTRQPNYAGHMADSRNPFEDPEVLAAMQQHGVVHKPGMAAQHLQELAPLLKAEGIDLSDLDNPNTNLSFEQLNAALARATEQRNLSLFTPVGRDRENALKYIRLFTACVGLGNLEMAMGILDLVKPDETHATPAGSHMIGVSIGLLDTWLVGADDTNMLPVVRVPKCRGKAPAIARDLIALARKGRAFDSHGRFIMQRGGEELMRGAALAVAAVATQVAQRDRVPVLQAFEGLVFAGGTPGQCPAAYRAIDLRDPAVRAQGDAFKEDFADWFDDGVMPEEEVHEMLDQLDDLEGRGLARQLDIHDPHGAAAIMALVEATRIDTERFYELEALEQYAQFRQHELGFGVAASVAPDSAQAAATPEVSWDAIATDVSAMLLPFHEAEAAEFAEALAAAETDGSDALGAGNAGLQDPNWSEDQRTELEAILDRSPIVTGLFGVIEWLEKPRQVTATGGVRRADITEVSAMIGVRAEGVAKEPAHVRSLSARRDPDHVFYARSMDGVPGLMDWWIALQAAGAIEVTKSRVRRGPAVSESGGVGHDTMLRVLAEYLVEVTSDRVDVDAHAATMSACAYTLDLLARCLDTGADTGADGALLERNTQGDIALDHSRPIAPQIGERMAWRRLLNFVDAGALERGSDGRVRVIPLLRGAVSYALQTAGARYALVGG